MLPSDDDIQGNVSHKREREKQEIIKPMTWKGSCDWYRRAIGQKEESKGYD